MYHLNYEFDASPGDTAEVTIDRAANVMLMDSANYSQYKRDQKYQYYGGYETRSPVRKAIPQPGHWHVVIDLGGGPGQVRASTRLLSGTLA